VEWKGCITQQGAFDKGGVGGLAGQTKDERMVLVPRADKKMQTVRCHSMNKVTTDFLVHKVSKAFQEVNADDPLNKLLQNCKVPDITGGEVDLLIGINYSLLHPEALHTLPTSGLNIYASKLKIHDGEMNAIIGGTHESNLKFVKVDGSEELLGDDGLFEEY
jgi:hypothetical protein